MPKKALPLEDAEARMRRSMALELGKFSFGVGDRFAHQAAAQLEAFQRLEAAGVDVVPVWNKSHREHQIIGSEPNEVRAAADAAVKALGWTNPYHVDADHIHRGTVDRFLEVSDFYTIDVADSIGKPASAEEIDRFVSRHGELVGELAIPGVAGTMATTEDSIRRIVQHYLMAVREAGAIYRHIAERRGGESFIAEVSMDETDAPQTPPELLVILADEGVPVQTIAPKFTGRFNKGVDYVGDLEMFKGEFQDDLAVIAHAVKAYDLPLNLKLSVHSGSDKFSLYAPIRHALHRFDAGLHVKTAGTTWLEELIGLAESGNEGYALAREIYGMALEKRAMLCEPYATVIDIDPDRLPTTDEVAQWTSQDFVAALRHEPDEPRYHPHFRQLLHVGFKMAASLGPRYTDALSEHREVIGKNVTLNLFERHLSPLFLGD